MRLCGLAFGLGVVCPGKKLVSGNVISPYPLKAFLVSQRKGKGLSSGARELFSWISALVVGLSFSLPINSRLRITAACSTATSQSRA